MDIGVLGGSFNPIHYGHLEIAERSSKEVDELWVMPCYSHQFNKKNAPFEDRYKMIELAIEEVKNKKIKVSDFEKRKNKKSTTIDTIKKIRQEYPKKEFYWVIGSDLLSELENWKNYEELIKKAKFLIVKRYGYEIDSLPPNSDYIKDFEAKTKVSSTEIRKKIRENESLKGFLPNKVIGYIKERGLYS